MNRLTAVAIAVACLVLAALPAAAGARRPNSFDGTCKLSGTLRFRAPLGNLPRATTFTDRASGTCDGTLNGRRRTAIPVVNRVTGSGTISCLSGAAHTADTLVFARRFPIRIHTDSAFAGAEAVAHSRGARSGDSVEHVAVHAGQATLAACAAGTLRTARYDLDAVTLTPLVG